MFEPPRCPRPTCFFHRQQVGRWWRRRGFYKPKCRAHRVPRFDCTGCKKSFSRQTFRADYRDKKPYLNAELFRWLVSGNGLRQSARMKGLHRNSLMPKAAKIGLHLLHFHRNMLRRLQMEDPILVLDEMESYEGSRRTRPVTIPVLIDRESRFVIAADADTLPARGKLNARHQRVLEADEQREGKRKNHSSRVVGRVLRVAARATRGHASLICDLKTTYKRLARSAFGRHRISLSQVSSKIVRSTYNPLFPINSMNKSFRDGCGRLRRQSWLASKKRRFLRIALGAMVCYRCYIRPRFNRDEKKLKRTPAQLLGLLEKPKTFEELLTWRQDWGPRSQEL